MAAFCRLKPPRVHKPPPAKDITDRQRRSHKSVVLKKKKEREEELHYKCNNYITHRDQTESKIHFCLISVLRAELNLLYFLAAEHGNPNEMQNRQLHSSFSGAPGC